MIPHAPFRPRLLSSCYSCRFSQRLSRMYGPSRCNSYSSSSRESRPPTWPPSSIATSSPLVHLKSTFQAFACPLPVTPSDDKTCNFDQSVPIFIDHLTKTTPRTKRASHAMWAWRASPNSNTDTGTAPLLTSCSDGGESGAGERLTRLLELSQSENVLLIVFRWYGGVKLSSQRWKCISSVAKEALESGEFARKARSAGEASGKGERKGKSKKKLTRN